MSFTALLWIVFLCAALMYSIYGVIFAYHWIKWSGNAAAASAAIISYAVAGIILFAIMLGSLLTYVVS